MTIKRLLQKAFIGGQWYIGYRHKGEKEYEVIKTSKGVWIADPMMFSANGEHYMFVEVFEECKKKASIGYYHFENGLPVYKGIIIEEPYHLSYPCVFAHAGMYYMIPESSANNCISLYRAEHFPDKWVKEADLLNGEKYVDSTVFADGEDCGILSYKSVKGRWELIHFSLDLEKKKLKMQTSLDYHENIGRPGGYIFDKCMRPAQNCQRKYGEELLIYKIDSFFPYAEHLDHIVKPKQIEAGGHFNRVHTYTEDGLLEAVDLFKEKVDLLHGFKILCRAYLRK